MVTLYASNGGIPSKLPDVPVDAVFIALFIVMAAGHMTLYQRNKKRGHNFLFSGMLFGFCMSRIAANVLRMTWAFRQTSEDIALSASVFLNAGILLVYVINDILAWRMVRSAMPRFGWNPVVRILYQAQLWLVLPLILMLITMLSINAKVGTPFRRMVFEDIAKLGQTYFFVLAASGFVWTVIALLAYRKHRADEFGVGSFYLKGCILLLSSFLATVEASYRLGTTWQPPRLITNPAWYEGKAAFFCFNFAVDFLIVLVLLVGRIDLRFHVPDHHRGVGSYSGHYVPQTGTTDDEKDFYSTGERGLSHTTT